MSVSTLVFHGENVTGQVRVNTRTWSVTFWPWNSKVLTDMDI